MDIKVLLILLVILCLIFLYKKYTKEKYHAQIFSSPIKSFGTTLISHPVVAKIAGKFRFSSVDHPKDLTNVKNFPNDKTWAKYKNYLYDIANQGNCGSCWAWSSAGSLSSRFCLLSGGKIKPRLSAGKLVSCTFHLETADSDKMEKWWKEIADADTQQKRDELRAKRKNPKLHGSIGCNGNDLYSTGNYLFSFGTTTEDCVPYKTDNNYKLQYDLGASNDPDNIPYCSDLMGLRQEVCAAKNGEKRSAARIYRANDVYKVPHNSETIKQEIYKWGPISAGFNVFADFLNKYDGKSIYMGPSKSDISQGSLGGHAIVIVGWGTENGTDYWWIANSWSKEWGLDGYFKMKQNIAECQLEDNIIAMKPQFSLMADWIVSKDVITQNAEMFKMNPYHKFNNKYLYYEDDVSRIKNGEITGDLTPIITKDQLPFNGDYSKFWVGDLING